MHEIGGAFEVRSRPGITVRELPRRVDERFGCSVGREGVCTLSVGLPANTKRDIGDGIEEV